MPNSNLDELVKIITNTLNKVMKDAQHLMPTLNDIYDTFNKLHLRIERTDDHSYQIIQSLKHLSSKTISKRDMIIQILKLYLDSQR
ncbi:hypothetical protein [Helicobacter pullorum]|uniref:hypothetical protein n=1 Tax=Helicobacter pullorum TaxID=35818 RepID=UPI000CF1AA36|nr:hypothetical protein [Helicobacter pullorum]